MKTTLTLAFTLAASAAFSQDVYNVDKVHSEVAFRVRHFVSKVSGRFDDFSGTITIVPGKPAASSVEFTIKTASINTANTGRDNHLRSADFFDAEKNPEITFKSTKIAPVDADTFNVTGIFTMHGTAKELTIPVDFGGTVTDSRGTEKAGFSLTTKLNRKDYGIVWNQTLDSGGMMLGDEVEITVNIEANKRKPAPADAPAAK
ncbi:MAG: YceI family protein [Vicinamibacteria bacterium]|nr:YceI family protein [Vicinamibacteria bacterium]